MITLQKNRKLVEILTLFEEAVILDLSYNGNDLNIKMECSFLAREIDSKFSLFYVVLKKCKNFSFQPWDYDMLLISDPKELKKIKPEILSVEEFDEETIKIYSNCTGNYTGGNLYVSANDIKIYDEEFNELNLDKLQEISENYWYMDRGAEG